MGSTLGKKAKAAITVFATDLMSRVAHEAAAVASLNNRRTVSTRDALAAVKITLNGELREHAVTQGHRALFSMKNGKKFKKNEVEKDL